MSSIEYNKKQKEYIKIIEEIKKIELNKNIKKLSSKELDKLIYLKDKEREFRKYLTKNIKNKFEKEVKKPNIFDNKITFKELNNNINEYNIIKKIVNYVDKYNCLEHNYYQTKYAKIYKKNKIYKKLNMTKKELFRYYNYFWFYIDEFWDNEILSFDCIWRYKKYIDYNNLRFEKYNLSKIEREKIEFYYFCKIYNIKNDGFNDK